jgi:hypothetical protein
MPLVSFAGGQVRCNCLDASSARLCRHQRAALGLIDSDRPDDPRWSGRQALPYEPNPDSRIGRCGRVVRLNAETVCDRCGFPVAAGAFVWRRPQEPRNRTHFCTYCALAAEFIVVTSGVTTVVGG